MTRTYCIRAVKIVSLLLAVAVIISAAYEVLFFNKRDVLRVDGFRQEEKNSLDVVLLGASEVYTAFSPPYAYELEGFTSFPYSVASCPVTLWRTMLEDTLSRQTPQLVVVEISGVTYFAPDSLHNNTAMHYVLDGMPLSANKIRTLRELCSSDTDGAAYFLFPVLKYHSVWQDPRELKTNYLDRSLQRNRGYTLLRGISTTPAAPLPVEGVRDVSGDYTESALSEEAERYLLEFLQYCREKNLNVLFASFPHQIGLVDDSLVYENFTRKNRAERIIRENGFPFLNLERTAADIGIDPEKDYYNVNHLNLRGQLKVTEYLSKYLVEECGVTPRPQSEAVAAGWAASTEYYRLYCAYVQDRLDNGLHVPDPDPIAENAALVDSLNSMKS